MWGILPILSLRVAEANRGSVIVCLQMSWAFGFWVALANTLTDGLSRTAATNRHVQTDPWECKPAGIISAEVGRELINGSACLQSFQCGIEGVCK